MENFKNMFLFTVKKHCNCKKNKTGELIYNCEEKNLCENYKLLKRLLEILIEDEDDKRKNIDKDK